MKLDKFKKSNNVEKRAPQYSTWENKRDRQPLPNIHGVTRGYKESPQVVRDRIEISQSYRGKLDGRESRKDSLAGVLEWQENDGSIVQERKRQKMGKKR